jgi:tRNA A-37 threonylcarbamoyl transferase component Bud32
VNTTQHNTTQHNTGTLKERVGEVNVLNVVKGIVEGMIHLHKHNIIHGNLTAKNVLLTKSGEPKISVSHLFILFIIDIVDFCVHVISLCD